MGELANRKGMVADADLEASPGALVWVNGTAVDWPPECACCLGPADQSKGLDFVGGPGVAPYPVCSLCRRHAFGSDIFASAALLGALGLVGGGYYLLFGTAFLKGTVWLTGMVLVCGIAVVGFVLHRLLNHMFLVTAPGCAGGESPVARLGPPLSDSPEKASHETDASYAERMRCLRHLENARATGQEYLCLSFTNREYARRFVGSDPSFKNP